MPGERFELPTNGLQNRCSTAELTRHTNAQLLDDALIAGTLLPIRPANCNSRNGRPERSLGTIDCRARNWKFAFTAALTMAAGMALKCQGANATGGVVRHVSL